MPLALSEEQEEDPVPLLTAILEAKVNNRLRMANEGSSVLKCTVCKVYVASTNAVSFGTHQLRYCRAHM